MRWLKYTNGGVFFVFSSCQHIVYLTKFILSYVIPDVPYAVKEQIKREKYLTQVILHETNLKLVTKRLKPAEDERIHKDTRADAASEELELDFWEKSEMSDCPVNVSPVNQRQSQSELWTAVKGKVSAANKKKRHLKFPAGSPRQVQRA